jgi:twitching motility two-component system response regulator PilH
MPAGSGVQVLRKLQNSAKTQHIPVIVISANEDRDLHSVVEQLGAAAFLLKPVEEAELCSVIARLFPEAPAR